MNDVTQLLHAMANGDPDAGDRLIPLVYDELRRMAARKFPPGGPDMTLEPTALVHEAWLKLGGTEMKGYRNRGHFFATAATAMARFWSTARGGVTQSAMAAARNA